jgi:outer membrane protein assembly factor BamB
MPYVRHRRFGLNQRPLNVLTVAVLAAVPVVPWARTTTSAEVVVVEGNEEGVPQDTGVYVRDSAIVAERVALAERMERSREWGKAADLLQEIIEKHGQRIVPVPVVAGALGGDGVRQYIGATDLVQRRLAKWPVEGLAAYDARFGHVAQALLDAAPFDEATLGKIDSEYFVTDAGKLAAIRRIDLALEAGEFGSAAWMADRLLGAHPRLTPQDRAGVLFRLGVARHLGGEPVGANRAMEELKAKHPDTKIIVAGQSVVPAEALAGVLKEPVSLSAEVATSSWPTLGGGPSRGRVPQVVARPGARLFNIELARPSLRGLDPSSRRRYQRQMAAKDAGGGVMPVVDRGELFFNDGQKLYAVSLDSGFPLPGWAATYPGDTQQGRYTPPGPPIVGGATGRQLNTTVTDDAVLAVMGQGDRILAGQTGRTIEPRLVCVDRKTGRQRWVVKPTDLPDESLRSMSFGGSPLVIGDNVYVTGRAAKQANFEDCYVLCFNLADGKQKWACYVSGAASAAMWMDGGGGALPGDNDAHVAFAGGRLFVSTNLGAVAAIDAYTGSLQWLTTYPRGGTGGNNTAPFGVAGPAFNRRMAMMNGRIVGAAASFGAPPWAYNPPVVRDGRLFVLPVDGRDLFVFDAGTGNIEKIISARHFNNLDTFVGIVGESVIFAGNVAPRGGGGANPENQTASIMGINWRTYDAKTFRITRFPDPNRDPSITCHTEIGGVGPLRGRPFLTSTDVFVPTERRLCRFDLRSSMVLTEGTYPYPMMWDRSDPDSEGPGNVLVVGDHVVLAGPLRVDVYTDRLLARRKLDASEAQHPSDPEPRLVYAEVMFVAGDIPLALAKLDEAAGLLGGPGNLRPGAMRDRLFNDALTFATKMTEAARPGAPSAVPSRQQAGEFFDRAAMSAQTPDQQVAWRLARARLFESGREFPNAVRMHQEILSDPALRAVPRVDERDGPVTAAAVAEKRINDIVTAAGTRQPYVSYELVAEEKYRAARHAGDPNALLEIARTYPNANVSTRALAAAADVYESAGDPRMAVHVLRQALRRGQVAAPGGADVARLAVVEAMARNYLKLPGGVDSAIARLSKAVRPDADPPLTKPMALPDGTTLSGKTFMTVLSDLRKAVGDANATANAQLADLRLPSRDEFEVDPRTKRKRFKDPFLPAAQVDTVEGVAALVVPRVGAERHDRVITWTGKSLDVYAAGENGKPVASFSDVTGQPAGAAWIVDELVVWTDTTIWRLAPDKQSVRWTLPIGSLPTLPALPADDSSITDDELAATDTDGIDVGPQGLPPGIELRGRVRINAAGQRIVINGGAVNAGQLRLQLAGENGVVVPDPTGPEQILDVRPTATRVVVLTTTGRLAAFDATSGTASWQVRIADRVPQRLVATDEFTVARSVDEAGTSSLLVVDTFWGTVLARPRFPMTTGAPLTNFNVSPQGVLVYTQTDRLATKDLFEPWEGKPPNERVAEGGPGGAVFAGAVGEEQLVVGESRVAALSGGGMVRVYSLLTQGSVQQLATGGTEWDASLRLVGSQLYTVSPNAYRTYDLDRPTPDAVVPSLEIADRPPTIRGALFGKGHVILLDTMGQGGDGPPGAEPRPSTTYRLWAFSRDRVNGVESAMIDYNPKLPVERAGITKWQAVNGGLYYHTADGKLKFLRGAGK